MRKLGIALTLLLWGCASLIHGSHQTIPISTDPEGTSIQVGGEQYISPVDASLARNRNYQVVASKPGYQTQTFEIQSSFSAVTFVDLIFIIPWAVDLVDGAAYKLEPETIELHLIPIAVAPVVLPVPATPQTTKPL
jgi:hypothetical protein